MARTVRDIHGREWGPRRGLEGPFLYRSGRVLYYDPREGGGTYYDPTNDMYLSHDEAHRITKSAQSIRLASVSPSRVTNRQIIKTAGEVRFIKDKSGDANQWAWDDGGASERSIPSEFQFNSKLTKDLARVLRSTNMALGHAMSGYSRFNKMRSARISPDGNLGGRGYVQKINNLRRAYTNITEALSAISDTLYDEINGPHWVEVIEEQSPKEKQEVQEILSDVEEIREDPEEWAEDQEEGYDDGLF